MRKQHLVAEQQDNQIQIKSYDKWTVRSDLLSSGPMATDYLVDVEEDGRAYLRFGFGEHGRLPSPNNKFVATYRIGTGSSGNVRADTLAHIASTDTRILLVRNPLDAQGGTDRESTDDVQLYAPSAIESQLRCVTEEDYSQTMLSFPEVIHAVTQLRWTGSWHTAYVYVQRSGDRPVNGAYRNELARLLKPYCLIGCEFEICTPLFVPLHFTLDVQLKRGYDANSVGAKLAQAFSHTHPQDGAPGFFYPDNFSFGQTLYASQILATAMNVPGVAQVFVKRFYRLDQAEPATPPAYLTFQPLEIPRLDNDPSVPQNGMIAFNIKGDV